MSESDPSAIESSAATEQVTITEAASSSRKKGTLSTAEWKKIAERRKELDEYSCANCNTTEGTLTVHHIVPDTNGGTTTLSNLRTLCLDCHDKVHIDDYAPKTRTLVSKESAYVPMVRTLRHIISTVKHPLDRAIWVLLAKTGMGVDELVGLEFDQLHLPNHPLSYDGIGPRRVHQPHHIRLPAKNTEGIPGPRGARMDEVRVPLDTETERVLRKYLSIRPAQHPSVEGNPVFLGTKRNWGTSISSTGVHHLVEKAARRTGHYETGSNQLKNVTPITLAKFFKERFGGQPTTKDYILGRRDNLPMRFDRLATDYREGVPSLL